MRRALVTLSLCLGGCFGRSEVTRVAGGETLHGRFIDEVAYASYLRAALLDAAGDRERALEELDRALEADPDSPEILTRVGELRCGPPRGRARRDAGKTELAGGGLSAFARALTLDPSYAPAWYGRALCLERLGRRAEALAAAERAVHFDPLRVENTTLVAHLLFVSARPREAWIWLDGLALLKPGDPEVERARLAAAERHDDAGRAARARRSLAAGDPKSVPAATALARALAENDLGAARARALELRLSAAELALRAATLSPELALEQALLVLRADPSESGAWTAALVASDRLSDEAHFREALGMLDDEPLPPSPRALELLAELLERRTGPDGAAAFRKAAAEPAAR